MIGGFIEPIGDVVCRDDSSLYENVMISFNFSKPEIDYMRDDILETRRTLKRLRKECKSCGCIMGAIISRIYASVVRTTERRIKFEALYLRYRGFLGRLDRRL